LLIFAAGIGAGIAVYSRIGSQTEAKDFLEKRSGDYTFINPLLECEIAEALLTNPLRPFKNKLENFLEDLTEKQKLISTASVYFRDLNNGPWIGINEKKEFSPASLLKVPIMMAVLKQSETNPNFLQKKVTLVSDGANANEHFKPNLPLEKGEVYPVEELMTQMIIGSDNDAKDTLLRTIDIKILGKIFQEIGVEEPTINKTDNFITVKSYASFFRILFNASFLEKAASEKALFILSQVEFTDGLKAGIPGNIAIAHKFGERDINGSKQLHDCGIIYYPSHPYLLCIMTRGSNLEKMLKAIANISRFVYQEVDLQRTK